MRRGGPTLLYGVNVINNQLHAMMTNDVPMDFIANLPKIELHAHLNGSLCTKSIIELGEKLYGTITEDFINSTKNFADFQDFKSFSASFEKFKVLHELTANEIGLKLATKMVIRDFVADNVIYLELRTTPKCTEHMTRATYLTTVLDAIETAEEVKTGKIIVKLLPSIDRSKPVEDAIEMLNIVINLRQMDEKYLKLITGIDLSGNPECGNFEQFKTILEKARENDLKLALHCAEIDNPKEVQEMIEFGMNRCGHGTFLSSEQIENLAKQDVAIECCLTSNVKSRTVPNYSDHHFKHIIEVRNDGELSKNVVLCTDDCGVFDITLSEELAIAARTFKLNINDIKQLQLNAVDHVFTTGAEKNMLRDKILNDFILNFNKISAD